MSPFRKYFIPRVFCEVFKIYNILWVYFCLACFILLFGCIEKELDFDSIKSQNWSSEWAIPLINSSITMMDLVNDSSTLFQEGEDGLLMIVFETSDFFSYTGQDIPFIPDQQKLLSENFILPDEPIGNPVSIPVTFTYQLEADEPGVKIDSAILKSGSYTLSLTTDLNKQFTSVHVTLPGLINQSTGNQVEFDFDMSNPNGYDSISRDTTIQLEGHTLRFNNASGHANELIVNAVVSTTNDNQPNLSPYFLELRNTYSSLSFQRCFGYIGHQVINFKDTIEMDFFDVNEEGNFTFGPGSVNLKIGLQNSFGLPVLLDILKFRAYHFGDVTDSVDIYIFGEGNPSQFTINYPGLEQIGAYSFTEVNTENSNISEAIQISPNKMYLDIDGHLNPDSDSTLYNFILDTSAILTDVTVEMSLFGGISGFKIADTVEFNLGQIEEISSLLLVVDASNGYPIEARLQLDFVDSVYHVLHSLLPPDEQLISAAPVGSAPEYRVTGPVQKITNIVLNDDQIQLVQSATKIIINAILSSTDGQLVKIYSNYKIDLLIGAKVGINY